MIDSKIINFNKTDYERPELILGAQDMGIGDSINKHYPEIWAKYKKMKSLDWDENEFNFSSCLSQFKSCSKSTYDMMIKTLSWQWEADTIASKSIMGIMAPFMSSYEMFFAWQRISDNESIHTLTYSEIVRNSFDNPKLILDEILKIEESKLRLVNVAKIMSEAYEASHLYALGKIPNNQETYNKVFMFIVAMLCLERIQFMSSFAVTFAICDTGMFQPIGKAVQKIAQDELEVHVEFDKAVLRELMKTERGIKAFEMNKDKIINLIDEVVDGEFAFNKYLYSEGRELVGMNEKVSNEWSAFCAKDVYNFFGVHGRHVLPKNNPLRFMERWLDISKTQPSPQEQDNGQYKTGQLKRNDQGVKFTVDF